MMAAFVLFVVWLGGAAACAFLAGAFSRDDELGSWAFLCAAWPLGAIAVTVIGPFYAAFWLGKKLRRVFSQEGEANG